MGQTLFGQLVLDNGANIGPNEPPIRRNRFFFRRKSVFHVPTLGLLKGCFEAAE